MGDAKSIVVKPIGSAEARDVVRRIHYSGKVVVNSTLHLGVFYAGRLEGAMQFGPPMSRRLVLPLVRGTKWNQMLELNRMALGDRLPRNSESRAMAVAFRMMRKHRPDIKWILSFSDATQCGDGTIYRASGFVLTGVRPNKSILLMPDGTRVTTKTLSHNPTASGRNGVRAAIESGAKPLPGYQLRYIYFLDPSWRDRLTVPVIPFDKIPDAARMYRGKRQPVGGSGDQPEERPCESDPGAPPSEAPDGEA